MNHLLLRQARVVDPVSQTDRILDVLVAEGAIVAVAPTLADLPPDTAIRDCHGLILGPGLVDCYSYSGDPGHESRETLESLYQAAMAGGFRRLTILPTTTPAIDTPALVAQLHQRWDQLQQKGPDAYAVVHLSLWSALTRGASGTQMVELAELAASDIVGFTDGQPIADLALVHRLLDYAHPLGKPIALWACDPHLAKNGILRDGLDAIQLGLPSLPVAAETAALSAILELVATTHTPVHLMRISTARSVELIRLAKAQGLPITASTPWMHLVLNTSAVHSYDPSLRLDPSLGTPTDQIALINAVQTGIIDAIAIDHRPYTYEEKTVPFAAAPPGAIGLELALPLLWKTLVEPGTWSALDLWQALSTRPASFLGHPPQSIAPNQPAEILLFDPQQTWQITPATLRSQARNTPWLGQTITGKVISIAP